MVPTFQIGLRDMIHNSLCSILMKSCPTNASVQSWAMFRTLRDVNFRRVFCNRIIRSFKESHFSESITPKILNVWKLSFFWKFSKFYVHLKNAWITPEIIFTFEDKCVDLVPGISVYYDKNTCERPSTF